MKRIQYSPIKTTHVPCVPFRQQYHVLSSNLMQYADWSCWEMMVHQNEWKCGPGTRRQNAAYQHLSRYRIQRRLLITFQFHIQ